MTPQTQKHQATQNQTINPTKYVVYHSPKEFNRYFRQCERQEIPFVAVSQKGDISTIEFDLITTKPLTAFEYEDLLALRDDLFERQLCRDAITSRGNGLLKVKSSVEQETLEKLWVIVSKPKN